MWIRVKEHALVNTDRFKEIYFTTERPDQKKGEYFVVFMPDRGIGEISEILTHKEASYCLTRIYEYLAEGRVVMDLLGELKKFRKGKSK